VTNVGQVSNETRWTPPTRSHLSSDIQRKVISTRIVSAPPLSAQRTHQNVWMGGPHLVSVFLGSNVKQRGNIKRSALGELLP